MRRPPSAARAAPRKGAFFVSPPGSAAILAAGGLEARAPQGRVLQRNRLWRFRPHPTPSPRGLTARPFYGSEDRVRPIPSWEGWPVGPGWVSPCMVPSKNPPRRSAAPLQGGDKKTLLSGGGPLALPLPGSAAILAASGLEARTPQGRVLQRNRCGGFARTPPPLPEGSRHDRFYGSEGRGRPIPSWEGWPVGPGWVSPCMVPSKNPPRPSATPPRRG